MTRATDILRRRRRRRRIKKSGNRVILIFSQIFSIGFLAVVAVIAALLLSGVAAAVALQTERGRALWQFAGDARNEVRKVVWPTRQETLQTTLIVIVMVLILGVILWLFDMVLMSILRFLTGQGA
jgi:preprotein translocase subunit SecE